MRRSQGTGGQPGRLETHSLRQGAHYSWPKAAAVLGIGQTNLRRVEVDADGRLKLAALIAELDACVKARRPVLMVVAVVGSTEESSVDPVAALPDLRETYRKRGLNFQIHCDAAWGGYFASLLRRPAGRAPAPTGDGHHHVRQFTPDMVLSHYVERQLQAMAQADSITVDPHKAGCVPYPAGALCYRNSATRSLVSLTAPVVYHGGVDPTVGVYGIEGSKPGAAAAAVFLSHRVIRPDRSGYGKLLGRCLFNSTRFYSALVTMADERDPFIVVPFQRLPAERQGESPAKIAAQRTFIRERIVPKTNEQLLADRKAMALFRELGSDLTIVTYAFNFRAAAGLNRDVGKLNELNDAIFQQLSLHPDAKRTRSTPLIITSSSFDRAVYGHDLVEGFKARLGVTGDADTPVSFLISTALDPWFTDTAAGSFIPTMMAVLRRTVIAAIRKVNGGDHKTSRRRRPAR